MKIRKSKYNSYFEIVCGMGTYISFFMDTVISLWFVGLKFQVQPSQKLPNIDETLAQCWPTVLKSGPALTHHHALSR